MRLIMNSKDFTDMSVYIDKLNVIIGPNASGKTTLVNILANGFGGKMKKQFIYNGNEVGANDFFVYYIGECDTLDKERLLGSKTELKSLIDSSIGKLDEDECKVVTDKIDELKRAIQIYIFDSVEVNEGISINLDFSIDNLVGKFAEINYNEQALAKLSMSDKRIAYIHLYLDIIRRINQPSILIVDGIDNYLSEYATDKLINDIHCVCNDFPCTAFITTNRIQKIGNPLYVYNGIVENNLIVQEELYKYLACERGEDSTDFNNYYSDDEKQRIICKSNVVNKCIRCFLGDVEIDNFEKLKKLLIFNSK